MNDLALRAGDRYERNYVLDMHPIMLGGAQYDVLIPRGVNLTVDRVAGGFLIVVSLSASIYGPCGRCLRDVVLEVDASEEEFVPSAKDGWPESDVSAFVENMVVDVAGLAREATVLALPGQILCSESCRGLCPRCGRNLNLGACDCASSEVDERWSRLKDLKLEE